MGRASVLGILAILSGCAEPEYEIVVRFEPEALAGDVSAIEVALIPACSAVTRGDPAVSDRVVSWRRGATAQPLGVVDPGSYGLYARGLSATCAAVAAGCTDVALEEGGEGRLVVTLEAVTGPGCPTGTECRAGACERATDGGVPGDRCESIVSVGLGEGTTCAVGNAGELWCWGDNTHGTLGIGTSGAGTERVAPVRVGTDTTWAQVASGQDHACAVRMDGSLWCWGAADNDQLGLGDGAERHAPERVGTGTSWRAVRAGKDHTCALDAAGDLWCWGEHSSGQVGAGDPASDHPAPTRVSGGPWAQMDAGWEHTCAIDEAGQLFCWGLNAFGELGDGTSTMRTAPVQVGADNDFLQVACGNALTCALRMDGTLWCWGDNRSGQLGQGVEDTDVHPTPLRVGTETDWTFIAAGDEMACGLRAGGQLFCWGENDDGDTGVGVTSSRIPTPTRVGDLDGWSMPAGGDNYGCATRPDASLFCWGFNATGQLGLGDRNDRRQPEQVCAGRP